MILKGLPEFFSENRRRSAKGLPLLTWREFQRLKATGFGEPKRTSGADCPAFFQSDSKRHTPELPLLEAPVYHRTPETPSTGLSEPLVGVPDVISEDYLESPALGVSEARE